MIDSIDYIEFVETLTPEEIDSLPQCWLLDTILPDYLQYSHQYRVLLGGMKNIGEYTDDEAHQLRIRAADLSQKIWWARRQMLMTNKPKESQKPDFLDKLVNFVNGWL